MFSLITGRHIGGPRKLYQVVLNPSANNADTMYRTDVVKRFVSYNIPSSWPFSFHDFEFIFMLRDSVNDTRREMKNRVSYCASQFLHSHTTTIPCAFDTISCVSKKNMFSQLESCLVRSLQAFSLRQQ